MHFDQKNPIFNMNTNYSFNKFTEVIKNIFKIKKIEKISNYLIFIYFFVNFIKIFLKFRISNLKPETKENVPEKYKKIISLPQL